MKTSREHPAAFEPLEDRLLLSTLTSFQDVIASTDFIQMISSQSSSTPAAKLTPSGVTADINGDGLIDSQDVSIMAAQWDPEGNGHTLSQGDLNGDGSIDSSDAAILIANLRYGSQMTDPGNVAAYQAFSNSGMLRFVREQHDYVNLFRNSTDGSSLGWGEARVLDAYICMYEGTGDHRYLLQAMDDIDRVFADRADKTGAIDGIRDRVMPAWLTTQYVDSTPYAWTTHAAMLAFPVARFVYLVERDPLLSTLYGTKAQQYEQAITETLDAFDSEWRDLPDGQGYYIEDRLGETAVAVNGDATMGRAMLEMWLATGESKYLDRAQKLALHIKSELTLVNGGYQWAYWPAVSNSSDDLSHASSAIDFAVNAYEAGVVFTESDLRAFAVTVDRLAQYDTDGNIVGWKQNLDGSGPTALNYAYLSGRLAKYDATLARDLAGILPKQTCQQLYAAAYLVLLGKNPQMEQVFYATNPEIPALQTPESDSSPSSSDGDADTTAVPPADTDSARIVGAAGPSSSEDTSSPDMSVTGATTPASQTPEDDNDLSSSDSDADTETVQITGTDTIEMVSSVDASDHGDVAILAPSNTNAHSVRSTTASKTVYGRQATTNVGEMLMYASLKQIAASNAYLHAGLAMDSALGMPTGTNATGIVSTASSGTTDSSVQMPFSQFDDMSVTSGAAIDTGSGAQSLDSSGEQEQTEAPSEGTVTVDTSSVANLPGWGEVIEPDAPAQAFGGSGSALRDSALGNQLNEGLLDSAEAVLEL